MSLCAVFALIANLFQSLYGAGWGNFANYETRSKKLLSDQLKDSPTAVPTHENHGLLSLARRGAVASAVVGTTYQRIDRSEQRNEPHRRHRQMDREAAHLAREEEIATAEEQSGGRHRIRTAWWREDVVDVRRLR